MNYRVPLFIILVFGIVSCAKQSSDTLRECADQQNLNLGMAVHNRFFNQPVNSKYQQLLKNECNTVVAENAMKPYALEPERGKFRFSQADKLVNFAQENGMKIRGHCLVWHKQIPRWMNNEQLSREELLSVLKEYITTVVSHFKGKVFAWDVVNEAIDTEEPDHFRKTVWLNVIGPAFIDSAFVWAHRADPSALLFYNDYEAENMNEKSNAVYNLVKGMKERGIPIDGVGLQCHFRLGEIDFAGIKANMQRLAELGVQTQITELDISIDTGKESQETLKEQAESYGKMAKLWLDDENCTAFVVWGLSDQYSWIPEFSKNERGTALLFDKNFKKKPACDEILNLLKNTSEAQVPQGYKVATWDQFKTAAVSYTFDDNTPNQLAVAEPLLDQYHLKATFFTVTDWNPDWHVLAEIAEQGFEVASHTVSHPSLDTLSLERQEDELSQSQNTINTHIPGALCLTTAYPYCNIGDLDLVRKYYIAARACSGIIEGNTPNDFYNISSIVTGEESEIKTAGDFNRKVKEAETQKGWCVFLIHAIDNDQGYSPTSSQELAKHFVYVNDNPTSYWVAPFVNVVKYIRERNAIEIREKAVTPDSLQLKITDHLDNLIYNEPVSIQRILNDDWQSARIYRNGKLIPVQLSQSDRTVVFDVIPDDSVYFLVGVTNKNKTNHYESIHL